MQEWQKNLLAIPMNLQILGRPRTKAISRNDSFYSGMAVSLTCQSCGLACPQRLIPPLTSAVKQLRTIISTDGQYATLISAAKGKKKKSDKEKCQCPYHNNNIIEINELTCT